MSKKKDDAFTLEETQKRFEAALRGARIAGHKERRDLKREQDEKGPAKEPKNKDAAN